MKKRFSLVLLVVAMLSLVACGGTTNDTEIIVGNTTELTGDWIPYWQNNAADYDVYQLITGLGTVSVSFEGEFLVNETVVDKVKTEDNSDGSKTYTFTIKDGLKYDDGTKITGMDYVASFMLWSSAVVGEDGATNTYGRNLLGWGDYSKGDNKVFTGVRIIDEMTYSVTISPENVPYYYELNSVSASPTKLDFWTDDSVEIKDDGEGAYMSDNFTLANFKDRFDKARRDVERPSTGAYVLESYDEAAKTAVLNINKNYAGNYEGQKPSIQTVIIKKVDSATSLDELSTGSVDVLSAMSSGDEINAGLNLVDEGGFSFSSYPRAGYGKLQFVADVGPTQFVEVRQAVAHLLNRNEFAKTFTGGFGSVVNGPYGESMWFYQETKDELNEVVNQYPYSLDEAVRVLEEGGWVLDADGNDYVDGIRHKKLDDGTLMSLEIEWGSSEKNPVSELLVIMLQENTDVAAAGIKINQTIMSFTELLNWVYRDDSTDDKYAVPTYHMFNLASGFTPAYDLTRTYSSDPAALASGSNTNFIIDAELEKLAADMVLVDPTDKEEFKSRFVEFIGKWSELLPDVPLYSNEYHDFYNDKIENWKVNDIVELSDVILYANVKAD